MKEAVVSEGDWSAESLKPGLPILPSPHEVPSYTTWQLWESPWNLDGPRLSNLYEGVSA
jgi:hypothetical protein